MDKLKQTAERFRRTEETTPTAPAGSGQPASLYTFHDHSSAKRRRLLTDNFVIGGVFSQRVSEFELPLGSKADAAEENSLVPTCNMSFAEQIINDFGSVDDDLLEVWKLHVVHAH